MWLALSYLQSCFNKKIITKTIGVIINDINMKCEMCYYPKNDIMTISYTNKGAMCREVQIPLTSRKFALRMMEDLNQELAIEIYKTEIL